MTDRKRQRPIVECECSGCCGSSAPEDQPEPAKKRYLSEVGWVVNKLETPIGSVPVVSTELNWRDRAGAVLVRFGLRRMSYALRPGLYAVGRPNSSSYVFVSANYKLSFDHLRRNLRGLDAWILVLDTAGINVWCAAGKGSFGTEELIQRIRETRLFHLVPRGTLILPQLAAPGVAAHEVSKRTGFKVVYGPVRAADIKSFLARGLMATEEMRQVRFNFLDRLVLIPVDLTILLKYLLLVFFILLALRGLGLNLLHWPALYPYLGAIIIGSVLVPAFLPWIPGRPFAWKGWLLGLLWALWINVEQGFITASSFAWAKAMTNFLLLPALSAFLGLNFTGSSTYTSLSGVVREMKLAIPAILMAAGLGFGLLIAQLAGAF